MTSNLIFGPNRRCVYFGWMGVIFSQGTSLVWRDIITFYTLDKIPFHIVTILGSVWCLFEP